MTALRQIAHNAPQSTGPARPTLTPLAAGIVAWAALCLACMAAIATGYDLPGFLGLAALGIAVMATCDYRAVKARFWRPRK